MTVPSSSPTPAAASPRSSAVAVPVLVARSRTVKHLVAVLFSVLFALAEVARRGWGRLVGVYSIGVCIS